MLSQNHFLETLSPPTFHILCQNHFHHIPITSSTTLKHHVTQLVSHKNNSRKQLCTGLAQCTSSRLSGHSRLSEIVLARN